jgi:predicted glycogen debranching enzyme
VISIEFGAQICGHLNEGVMREWLVPDGCGGYAMGTVSGLRTRRYHALLVVNGATPANRRVGLVSLDPVLRWPSGAEVRLGTHEWSSGIVDPTGHVYLEQFDLDDGLPRWRWRVGDVVVERELAMAHGRPHLAVAHRLIAGGPVHLSLDVLCTWRDAHSERSAAGPPLIVTSADGGVVVEDVYRLAGPGWESAGQWWYGVYYREEAARGLFPVEDLWHAGSFAAELTQIGQVLEVSAWAGERAELALCPEPATVTIAAARQRNRKVVAAARPVDAVDATLALAADAFVVTTASGPDVIAGYPWFGVWSRDTLTSYEGLFLVTGRVEEGRRLLLTYATTLSQGMLPNTADTGRTEHNSADASLWFLDAVARHAAATGDLDLVADLVPAMREVIAAYMAGTRYGIRVDPADGLLRQGAPGKALTWMDALVDGVPITPRVGKPVELSALWVNGLAGFVVLCDRVGVEAGIATAAHDKARASFARRFPIPGSRGGDGLLYDVVDGPAGDDASLRPNQLLAWSLPHAPLRADKRTLSVIAAALLTPLGLRSLEPRAPGYQPMHRGGPRERDRGYHEGTVWPWLLGPYMSACVKAAVPIPNLFCGVEHHLSEFGLQSVSETADGQPPHAASGCPFQAWSVAELLRARRNYYGHDELGASLR